MHVFWRMTWFNVSLYYLLTKFRYSFTGSKTSFKIQLFNMPWWSLPFFISTLMRLFRNNVFKSALPYWWFSMLKFIMIIILILKLSVSTHLPCSRPGRWPNTIGSPLPFNPNSLTTLYVPTGRQLQLPGSGALSHYRIRSLGFSSVFPAWPKPDRNGTKYILYLCLEKRLRVSLQLIFDLILPDNKAGAEGVVDEYPNVWRLNIGNVIIVTTDQGTSK